MSSWQEQISDPAGMGVDHGEGENVAMDDDPSPVHYHWGQNIPGYLPMADEPNTAADWADARDALLEDMDRAGDMADADDYAPGWAESWKEAVHAVRELAIPGEDIYVNVASDGPHDLGVSYWVIACAEEECEVDDDWADDDDDDDEAGRATYASAVILLAVAGMLAAMVGHMVNSYMGMVG